MVFFSAPNFHLSEINKPAVLVGPGTGIAPFRSFWQQRMYELERGQKIGRTWLFFGCRQQELDLYKDEKAEMVEKKVLDRVYLALSREKNVPKVSKVEIIIFCWVIMVVFFSQTYVQDLFLNEADEIYRIMVVEKGHFYVCGDCTMAEHVYQTLKKIIQHAGKLNDYEVEQYMLKMRVSHSNRLNCRNRISETCLLMDSFLDPGLFLSSMKPGGMNGRG